MKTEIERTEGGGRVVRSLDGGDEAYVAFEEAGEGRLDFRRTFVPEPHRHQGIGERLVLSALDWARQQGRTVIPTCPFVDWVVDRNPAYEDLIAS